MISLAFQPEGFSDSSVLIFDIFSWGTSEGLPLLGLFFSPSRPSLSNLLSHLYAQAIDLWSSSVDTIPMFWPSEMIRLMSRILSFPYISIGFTFVSIIQNTRCNNQKLKIGLPTKSIVNKIIRLFYVFLLISIQSTCNIQVYR